MIYKGYELPDKIVECYNYEKKADFLVDKCKQGVIAKSIYIYTTEFVALSQYEKQFRSDILDMSKNKIATIFEFMVNSYANYRRLYTTLKLYFEFYNRNFYDIDIQFDDLEVEYNYEQRYIQDFAMLNEIAKEVFPRDPYTMNDFKVLTLYLCYFGFTKEEIAHIKKSDVHYEENSISYRGHIVRDLPKRCMTLCRKCADTSVIKVEKEGVKMRGAKSYRLCENDYLIRQRYSTKRNETDPCSGAWFSRILMNINEELSSRYSFDSIRASGLYGWLYDKEMKGEFDPNLSIKKQEAIFSEYFHSPCSAGNSSRNYKIWKQIFYGY